MMQNDSGFTLVELMAVMVIIGLMSAVAVLSLPGGDMAAVRDDAEKLGARLVKARQEAILSGRPVSAVMDDGGYRFDQYLGGRWQPIGRNPVFERESWSDGVVLAQAEDTPETRLTFEPIGRATVVTLHLLGDDAVYDVAVAADGAVRVGPGA